MDNSIIAVMCAMEIFKNILVIYICFIWYFDIFKKQWYWSLFLPLQTNNFVTVFILKIWGFPPERNDM